MVKHIITEMSRFRALLVIARSSIFTYKGKAVDVRVVEVAGDEQSGIVAVEQAILAGGSNAVASTIAEVICHTGG